MLLKASCSPDSTPGRRAVRSRARRRPLHDADDKRTAGAPLVAQQQFEHRRDGFRIQRRAGFANDDGRKRACEQPERVEDALESGGDGAEQRQRRGADEIPHPEDKPGGGGDGGGGHQIDDAPSARCVRDAGGIDFSIGHGSAFPCHMHIYGGRHGERDVRAPALSDSRSCGRSSRFLSACLASPRVRIQ